jgi:outer membrane protein assembly factor BamB
VGKVYALNAKFGSLRWTYDSKMEGIFCPTPDGKGRHICASWYNDYKSSEIGELRTINDHTLFAGSGDTLFAYKTTNGSKLWQYTFAPISSGNNDTISITDIVVIPPLV